MCIRDSFKIIQIFLYSTGSYFGFFYCSEGVFQFFIHIVFSEITVQNGFETIQHLHFVQEKIIHFIVYNLSTNVSHKFLWIYTSLQKRFLVIYVKSLLESSCFAERQPAVSADFFLHLQLSSYVFTQSKRLQLQETCKKELPKWKNNLKLKEIIGSNYILQIEYGEIYYKHIR